MPHIAPKRVFPPQLDYLVVFKGHIVVNGRSNGLKMCRILDMSTQTPKVPPTSRKNSEILVRNFEFKRKSHHKQELCLVSRYGFPDQSSQFLAQI